LNSSKTKIGDLGLEEILSYSLIDSSHQHIYNSGSHQKGSDISIYNLGKSVKSGIKNKGSVTFSSFRLGRFGDNLSEMIKFIDGEGRNYDEYFLLTRTLTEIDVKYSFYIIPSNIIEAGRMNWKTKNFIRGKKIGEVARWKTMDDNGISLSIETSMSNQLWITLKESRIDQYLELEVIRKVSDLGKNRFVATISSDLVIS
jgi:hypothetical protein